MSSHSVPVLPLDLERDIFEMTAELYPGSIPNLLLVAQRVREWVERIKYKTIILSNSPSSSWTFSLFLKVVRSNIKPTSFFRDSVRHLFVDLYPGPDRTELQEILSVCGGILSFTVLDVAVAGPPIMPGLEARKLQRLALPRDPFSEVLNSPSAPHGMFACVTHLDIINPVHGVSDETIRTLLSNPASLPMLTHLALACMGETSAVAIALFARRDTLEVFINMYATSALPAVAQLPSVDDVRFVCMGLDDEDYREDWINGTKGEKDFWARADAFVAKKRRGEIKPVSRCWIEPGDGI
ncbi:hypothetical protein MVEN_00443100 [Mycena venus]|uniref:Uncharacterized protein n=1 Tax=Mycena venus TaxID=2733690 RepID=A0A8H7D812_9AGAR|nr:hypothetical protein MVEN_00443100 [Mycena venus]